MHSSSTILPSVEVW